MKKALLCLLFIMAFSELYSQLQPLNNQYIVDGLSINPAYAGRREAMSVAVSYRNQWVGFEGAPRTETFSAHSPFLKENIGVGLVLLNNTIGITKQTEIMGNYSYSIKTMPGKLSFGLGAGITIKNKDYNDLRVLDKGDELLSTPNKRFITPDFSAGVYYYTENYYGGFSMPFFMNHRFNSASGKFNAYHDFDNCNYVFTGGYLWKMNEDIKLLPSTLFKFNPSDDKQVDLNIRAIFKDNFWLGATYRTNYGIILNIQYQINNQFRVAYSYGSGFSELSRYQKGTHEIMLRYDFKYLLEVVSPRYF